MNKKVLFFEILFLFCWAGIAISLTFFYIEIFYKIMDIGILEQGNLIHLGATLSLFGFALFFPLNWYKRQFDRIIDYYIKPYNHR